jgi:hypothetical protein
MYVSTAIFISNVKFPFRMRGIVPDDILDALKKKKLGLPGIDIEVQEERNAMQMGEFEVIKELLAAYPAAKVAKAQVCIYFKISIDAAMNLYPISVADPDFLAGPGSP